jgi:FkbM family methyltransferase
MARALVNRLKNIKEWLALRNVFYLGDALRRELYWAYDMEPRGIAALWDKDPDMLYLGPLLKPGATVIDVGANVGTFCYAALRSEPSLTIHAFEPIPVLRRRLEGHFPDVRVHATALSDRSGTATFKIPFIAGRRFNSRASLSELIDSGRYESLLVNTDTLDNVVAEAAIERVDLIKIDVEGHEVAVLEGSRETMRKHKPAMLVEIEQRHHIAPISEIFARTGSFGYDAFYLDRETRRFAGANRFAVTRHQNTAQLGRNGYVNNFLFLPRPADSALLNKLEAHIRATLERASI